MDDCWQIIESGVLSPEVIMAKDGDLLAQLNPEGPAILHFYEWSAPCLTYGHFTDLNQHLNLSALDHYQLERARRPTGGGIIFHLSDFAFSLLIPSSHPQFSLNPLDNSAFINKKVAKAVAHFTLHSSEPQLFEKEAIYDSKNNGDQKFKDFPFCMAKPTQYDLMIQGKKVGGAAQRRTKKGFLHQGSLSLFPPPRELLQNVLLNGEEILAAMDHWSAYLVSSQFHPSDLSRSREEIKVRLEEAMRR